MKTLLPIHEEMSAIILIYVRDHRAELSKSQAHALMRYAKDEFIMRMMENSFFRDWFDGDRIDTVEKFCERVIADLLEVYKEGVAQS